MSGATLTEQRSIRACVFERAGKLYGVPAHSVVQITFLPDLTPVPAAPEFVCGAMNLRGEIVPVLRIDTEIGIEGDAKFPNKHPVVVLQSDFGLVAVMVDRVLSVAEMSVAVSSQDVDGDGTSRYIESVCETEDRLITMVNHELLLSDLQSRVQSN